MRGQVASLRTSVIRRIALVHRLVQAFHGVDDGADVDYFQLLAIPLGELFHLREIFGIVDAA